MTRSAIHRPGPDRVPGELLPCPSRSSPAAPAALVGVAGQRVTGGASPSGLLMGPRPVAHMITIYPGLAVFEGELNGCSVCEIKFWKIPGPIPARVAVKIPTLFSTTVMGVELLCSPSKVSRTDTRPSGAPDGMMALTCRSQTKMGMAFTVTSPCVTSIETSWKVVSRGNAFTCAWTTGPRSTPEYREDRTAGDRAARPFRRHETCRVDDSSKEDQRLSVQPAGAGSATAQINCSKKIARNFQLVFGIAEE